MMYSTIHLSTYPEVRINFPLFHRACNANKNQRIRGLRILQNGANVVLVLVTIQGMARKGIMNIFVTFDPITRSTDREMKTINSKGREVRARGIVCQRGRWSWRRVSFAATRPGRCSSSRNRALLNFLDHSLPLRINPNLGSILFKKLRSHLNSDSSCDLRSYLSEQRSSRQTSILSLISRAILSPH